MIVQCEQCQTRFRIPDEKVSATGVRVRCTKCQHTFRVSRPPASAAAPAAASQPSAATPAPPRAPGVFDEPTRIGTLSGEELARLGLSAPAPTAPAPLRPTPPPVQARPTPPPVRRPAPEPADPLHDFGHAPTGPMPSLPSLQEGLRRAAIPPAPPAGAMALSTSQRPAVPVPAPVPAARLQGADLFGGFGDVDLAEDPVAAAPAQPFGAPPDELSATGERGLSPSAADQENARALFDLPRREIIPPLPPPPAPAAAMELELALPPPRSEGVTPLSPAAARAAEPGAPVEKGGVLRLGRQTLGLLANLAVAAALVLGIATVGRASLGEAPLELAALSPARLRDFLLPTRPLVVRDVSNGLYDTRDGRPVFLVRGEVENRSPAAARVRVRAALYDGEQRVKSAEGLAGHAATPEQLHRLASAEDALALRTRLDAQTRALKPGERAPFTLVFYEYPPALGDFRLELTPEALAP